MANHTTVESWTLADLSSALIDMHKDNKRIAVPIFQRGKRWKKSQQEVFIDSLLQGFPVGTMLFYEEKDEDGKSTYILIDGLQRGNCIKKYMTNPTDFFYDSTISDEFCQSVLKKLNADDVSNYQQIRTLLVNFIKEQKTFKGLQYYKPAKQITDIFHAGDSVIGDLIDIINSFFDERQTLYDKISMTSIPVVIYHGNEENLPMIFERINSQGTPLDQYEVYAASWPVNRRIIVDNVSIVECAIKKYDAFIADGFVIHGYEREAMRRSKKLNAFEYLFGLGKYLVSNYEILGFQRNLPDDTVNSLSFELVNACLNDTDKIRTLYNNIYSIPDINAFEKALYRAILFVNDAITPIISFKGNNRQRNKKLFHSKFQILSMISTSFKEMYPNGDYSTVSEEWNQKKDKIAHNLRLYYVYDILSNFWSEGGNAKIHAVAKPNRYAMDIPPRAWRTVLDGFYDKSMSRYEYRTIASPRSEEYVLLNCIYLKTFTAEDQLSLDKFDVEHIAPKEQLKKLIKSTNGTDKGLPISTIANLCYLPEFVNRSKRDKNFYQDKKYLSHVNLEEVESKYSFTEEEDLMWMDMPYGKDDFEALKEYYIDYCNNRFEKMKQLFCKSMGIDYEAIKSISEEPDSSLDSETTFNSERNVQKASGIEKIESTAGLLKRVKKSIYTTSDDKCGFLFSESKPYPSGNRTKYWYAYRRKPFEQIEDCEEKYQVLCFKDSKDIIKMPVSYLEAHIENMNCSIHDDGEISHWHIVLYKDADGHYKQLFSRPDIEEVDIDEFKE